MSWRRILYAFFVLAVAGIAALAGVVTGGTVVYRAVSQNQTGRCPPAIPPAKPWC
jgi:hypothetical protein